MSNIKDKFFSILKDKEKRSHYLTYLFFGVATTLVDWVTFAFLIFAFPYLNEGLANALGVIVSIVFAYFTNRKYVFKSEEGNILKEFSKFFGSRMFSLIFNIIARHPDKYCRL